MIKVGDRVRIILQPSRMVDGQFRSGTPGCYAGNIGRVVRFGVGGVASGVYVVMPLFTGDKWFFTDEVELIESTLEPGWKRCICGTLTSNKDRCCGCVLYHL